jgi:hypothetical protein
MQQTLHRTPPGSTKRVAMALVSQRLSFPGYFLPSHASTAPAHAHARPGESRAGGGAVAAGGAASV